MAQTQAPTLDALKLRRLLRERRERHQAVRSLTDRYLDLRDAVGRLEAQVQAQESRYDTVNASLRAELEEKRADLADAQAARDRATERFRALDCVPALVRYARENGYRVDEEACSVHAPRKFSPTDMSPRRQNRAVSPGERSTRIA